MSKQDMIELEGTVVEAMPNATFKVERANGHQILTHISGKLRMNFIRILPDVIPRSFSIFIATVLLSGYIVKK